MANPWRNRLFALTIIVAASFLFERQVSSVRNQGIVSVAWIVAVVAFSIIYRRMVKKPIIPKMPADPIYGEGRASGGMASRCLIVAVTDDALLVGPRFPFNLMFLPEVWGMEYNIPISDVAEVRTKRSLFGANVRVLHGESRHAFGLRVLDPEAFAEAIRRAVGPRALARSDVGSEPRRRPWQWPQRVAGGCRGMRNRADARWSAYRAESDLRRVA